MDSSSFWTWFIVEALGGVWVVAMLYFFFIRKFQKEQKDHAEKAQKDRDLPQ